MSPYRILLYWGLVGTILAPGRAAFAQEEAKLAFSLLRQNDDVSALIGVENPNAYQRLKRLPFGEFGSLSFGGSYRFQAEMFLNEQFSQEQDQSDIWYLNRVMVHAHARFARHWQVYAELNTSSVVSKANPTPVDEDHFSLNQAFVEYCPNDRFNVRVGRENIRLGSGRLVDVREGPNVRLSFDMAQMTYVQGATQVMAFAGVPVRNRFGSFDNEYLHFDEYLTAIYWTQRLKGNTSVDVYVMYKDEQNKAWNVGVGRDQRVSAGIRHFGQWKDLSYNNEFVYQTGRFGDQSIVGWTASFNLTQRVKLGDFPLQLGLKTEGISGDQDPDDGRLGTFDA
ncbi:MAG TPA: hypothetical protein DCP28_37935, partial [Cytophagales bacterium]|nr:hypothetical protein [Cytophagales bacterium]